MDKSAGFLKHPSPFPYPLVIRKVLSWGAILYFLFLGSHFFLCQLNRAANKPFWGDEIYGLNSSIRNASYGSLLLEGAQGQGSPSPLDYLVNKALDDANNRMKFPLKEEVYYRLFANFVTSVTPVVILLLFLRYVTVKSQNLFSFSLQILLLCLVPLSFYTKHWVYHFAAEIRPYALWNCGWILVLASGLTGRRVPLFLSLAALALTATASLFQIGMLFLSLLLILLFTRKTPGQWKKDIALFALPLIIALFYALKCGTWSYPLADDSWKRFWKLWSHESVTIPFMLVGFGLLFYKKALRRLACVPLSVLFLYLIGPFIVLITISKGFFVTERQFIYYDLTKTVFLLIMVRALPFYVDTIKSRRALIISFIFLALSLSITLRKKTVNRLNEIFAFSKKVTSGETLL